MGKQEHLSVEILEEAVARLSQKLADIKKVACVDPGPKQWKAPTKKDYVNAVIQIQQIIEE